MVPGPCCKAGHCLKKQPGRARSYRYNPVHSDTSVRLPSAVEQNAARKASPEPQVAEHRPHDVNCSVTPWLASAQGVVLQGRRLAGRADSSHSSLATCLSRGHIKEQN